MPRRRKELVSIKNWQSHPRYKWCAVYRQGGAPCKRYFKTEREAKVFANDKIVELLNEGVRHGPITERERRAIYVAREADVDVNNAIEFFITHRLIRQRSVTVGRAGEELVERREAEGKSKSHVKDLRMRFRAFATAHEGRLAADITTADVDAWLASFIGAPQTRLNIRRVIHNLFSYAVARGYASTNPVTASIRPKVPPPPVGILTPAQARALLNACPPSIIPFATIGLFAGLRTAEIERLVWGDVDLNRGFIHVAASKSKTAQRRLVTITPNLRSWLVGKNVLNEKNVLSGPVCPQGYRKIFQAAHKAAGIDPWPKNALRHSFASYHLAAHNNAASTAIELGHMDARVLFAHYREMVSPESAKEFWNIS